MLKQKYLTEWYDEKEGRFYGAVLQDGSFYQGYYKEGNFLPIYFGILDGEGLLEKAYEQLVKNPPENVEGMSYMPQIFYACGDEKRGLEALKKLGDQMCIRDRVCCPL